MHVVKAVLFTTIFSVAACTVELPTESTLEQGVTSDNRIAVNRIAVNRIAVNRIAVNRIAVNRIAVNRIAVNTIAAGDLLDTTEGREVFSYLVECAIPAGTTLEATVEGSTYEFPGSIGLAPRWLDRRLTSTEQGWISACMIARVNDQGHSLLISLRGPHEALAVTADEEAAYTHEEGAFYGDIFAPSPSPLQMYSCGGVAQDGTWSEDLALRACAREDLENPGNSFCWDHDDTNIGITYVGACLQACEERHGTNASAGYYERCHDDTTDDPKRGWAGTARFDQVITVFVQ